MGFVKLIFHTTTIKNCLISHWAISWINRIKGLSILFNGGVSFYPPTLGNRFVEISKQHAHSFLGLIHLICNGCLKLDFLLSKQLLLLLQSLVHEEQFVLNSWSAIENSILFQVCHEILVMNLV